MNKDRIALEALVSVAQYQYVTLKDLSADNVYAQGLTEGWRQAKNVIEAALKKMEEGDDDNNKS